MAKVDASKQTLFGISQSLSEIFEKIEEAGGELTEDIERDLSIKKEELTEKCKSYISAIRYLESDVSSCKAEKDRIDAIRKRSEGRIKFMKYSLKQAVMQFGEQTKTGGYKLSSEFNTISLSRSSAICINEDFVNYITKSFEGYVIDYFNNGKTINDYENEKYDFMQGFINSLNDEINAEITDEEERIEISERDLELINIRFDYRNNIASIINNPSAIVAIASIDGMGINSDVKSTDISEAVKNNENVSFAERSNDFNIRIS